MSAGNSPHYLDVNHPNYHRWKRSRDISFERGKFVKAILSHYKELSNLIILDVGSGFGGTVENFIGNGNIIYSVEMDEFKLNNQPEHPAVKKFLSDAFNLPFAEQFDIIILQDFIEHIEQPKNFFEYILNFLKEDGVIFLSTPNKFSILNFISDPHWGFPFVSLMSRKTIQKFFIPIFRKTEKHRKDIAELKSLKDLIKIFNEFELNFHLHTKFAVKTLFENPERIIWAELHLTLLKILRQLKLEKFLLNLANDRIGFVNKLLTPSFYFVLRRNLNRRDTEVSK